MEQHTHGEDGLMVLSEPDPVEEVTEAAVRIAEIEAARDIKLAQINARVTEEVADTEIDVLRAENQALREQLDRLLPSPEEEAEEQPTIVVVDGSEGEPAEEELENALPEAEPVEDKPGERKNPWLSQY